VAAGETRLLVDAGLSYKQIALRLEAIGEDVRKLDAVLVTHEHSDHVAGVPMLAKHGIPIYLTRLTAPAIDWGKVEPRIQEFQAGAELDLGPLRVNSFTIPHDTVDPVGFAIRANGCKVSIVTDLGYIPENVKYMLQGSHLMLLESNHDPSMLQVGPVPWFVKQRILSRKGHLSNAAAAQYIAEDLPADVRTLLLGHLSLNHNDPCIAEIEARQALERRGLQPDLLVLEREKPSPIFHL
jgi:phosphoribosyl 1,2-cyclic phosphodiesterase